MAQPLPDAPPPAPSSGQRPRALRRQYVVDGKTQFRVAGLLLAGLAVLAVIQTVALFTSFRPALEGQFDGTEVRALLLRVGLVQFGVTAVLALALGILLSHRFVGAALVLRRAIQGMRVGDSSCRLTLRSSDFLHDVASSLAQLREEQDQRRAAVGRALTRAGEALDAGDLARAQADLDLARRTLVPATDPAPQVAADPATRVKAHLATAP